MAKLKLLLFFTAFLMVLSEGFAGSYTLLDGQTVSGAPISYDKAGVVLKSDAGTIQPRVLWEKMTQDTLKALALEAKNPKDVAFIEPYIDEVIQEKAKRKEIVIRPVERVERPVGKTGIIALFSSPLGLVIFLFVYLANLYAAMEIAHFRNMPTGVVCGVSAVAPFVGPIIFLCLPTKVDPEVEKEETAEIQLAPATAEQVAAVSPVHETPAPVAPEPTPRAPQPKPSFAAASQPVAAVVSESIVPQAEAQVPATVTFKRGDFTFNRRFFETKMPGFFRIVQSEAEKELVLYIKATRGEFIGRRISKINQTELYLEIFKDNVSAEEMIPFTEIQEVQIRHKDIV